MKIISIFFIIFFVALMGIFGYFFFKKEKITPIVSKPQVQVNEINNSVKLVDFSKINSEFLFSAEIPKEFEVKYISQLRAINIYNPNFPGENNVEKSQIYITFFRASRFLTLSTVEITRKDSMNVGGKEAVLYEITKKPGVPNFLGQPSWRNFKHKAIDIRLSKTNPSHFYSFAYNPNLPEKIFNDFIDSLIFYNQ